jgi:cation diffusion facilitator family transporter
MKNVSDLKVVVTSVVVSISDVALNLIVAILTGSVIMMSQALQGFSDLITGGMLYIGVRRSKRRPNSDYQFGYGRELFFWVLLAGIVMFVGTGAASVYLGYQQFVNPNPLENVYIAVAMLVFGFVTNLYALQLSIKRIREQSNGTSWLRHILGSSIVETKATFTIDFLGTSAAVLGFVAMTIYIATGNAQFDGLGSIVIGLTMMAAAVILINDIRNLIVGKSVDSETSRKIITAAESINGINEVLDLRTMYLGSAKLLVILEVHVKDGLETDEIEVITDKVKAVVQEAVPLVHHIQVEVETPDKQL